MTSYPPHYLPPARFTISIFESADLEGLTGPEGQPFCVIYRDEQNPLASAWAWCDTIESAQDAKCQMDQHLYHQLNQA